MPKLNGKFPAYRLHKASGNAIVTIAGKDHYLGEFDSPASRREYDRVIAEWLGAGRPHYRQAEDKESSSVYLTPLLAEFLRFARQRYNHSVEHRNYIEAIGPVKALYGGKVKDGDYLPATEFGPKEYKAVREEMFRRGWSRTYTNRQMLRIRRIFRWAVSEALIPVSVYETLRAVEGIKRGERNDVRETHKVRTVPDATVEQTLPHLPPTVADMVKLQRLTGMRPGELCAMRGVDLDMSVAVWLYTPQQHKTLHHDHVRTIFIGPKAQEILRKYLRPNVEAHLFQPAESEHRRRQLQHEQRKTPLSCGNRPGTNKTRRRERAPGDRYDVATYRRAIARACDRAFPVPEATPQIPADLKTWQKKHRWHPHQLRHTAATEWRKQVGAEHVGTLLGDRTTRMVDVYAERDTSAAMLIAQKYG